MKQLSDKEIIKSINIGNEDAFEFVFLTLYNELCVYAYEILKDRDNAEEVVQEVFVKLWENHMKFKNTILMSQLLMKQYMMSWKL